MFNPLEQLRILCNPNTPQFRPKLNDSSLFYKKHPLFSLFIRKVVVFSKYSNFINLCIWQIHKRAKWKLIYNFCSNTTPGGFVRK
jgi:hypothetical protein